MAHPRSAPTISAVLIVKDEEAVLAACLESVAWADEVVVYDTGSTDATREIARRYTDRVVEGYWDDDFGGARNRATDHATGHWVFTIDADEVFEGDDALLRRRLVKKPDPNLWGVRLVSGRASSFSPATAMNALRLYRADTYTWRGQLHEQLVLRSPSGTRVHGLMPDMTLHHRGYDAEVLAARGKGGRNLELARAELARAVAAQTAPADLAIVQANLARSLMLAGHVDEGLDAGQKVLDGGHLGRLVTVQLAMSMAYGAHASGDAARTRAWLTVWEQAADNPAWALSGRARMAAERDDAAEAIAALERIPTTTTNADGLRLNRYELAQTEVWALARLGREDDALVVAADAVRRGHQPGSPAALVRLLGDDRVRRLLDSLRPQDRAELAGQCVLDGSRPARRFLELMDEAEPHDPAVLAAARELVAALPLEEAARWAAALRQVGLEEDCPLVALAADRVRPATVRALAAALAHDAYGDPRALALLETALADVAPDDEAELLVQLDLLAPGLVSAAV